MSNNYGKGKKFGFSLEKSIQGYYNYQIEITDILENINVLLQDSNKAVNKMIYGDDDLTDVVIAAEKTSLSLNLAMRVRNTLFLSYCHFLN